MEEWYEIKVKAILGPDAGDDKEVKILGRVVRWLPDEIQYEADDKYVKTLCSEMEVDEKSKGLDGPIVKEDCDKKDVEDVEMSKGEATHFRGLAATANFLAQDRPDIQYAAKEICRDMARPKMSGWRKLKRLTRYLKKYPRVIWRFKEEDEHETLTMTAMSDSDWAGCLESRKSTSGGMITIQGGCVKSWSSTQGSVAMSSGEAEYYAMVKAAAEALGAQAVAKDLGVDVKIRLGLDSSAAKSMAERTGLGKVRHIEIRLLWLQEVVKRGRVELLKLPGKENPSDLGTKPKTMAEIEGLLKRVNLEVRSE